MCHHSALVSMQYLNNKYKPDEIVASFDSHSWRKEYVKYAGITHKPYKGKRRQNLSQKEIDQLKVFDAHIQDFHEFLKENTTLIVLKGNLLECDDLIAGFVDKYPDDKHIIISTDKDFMQLLDNPNVTLIEPDKEKKRTLLEWDFDHKHFMFEKCIRGDTSDNVISSYPKLRKTKIDAAYKDEYLKTNLMEHEFEVEEFDADGNLRKHSYKTKELFEENELLMDLRQQPVEIRARMEKTIVKAMNNRGKFNVIKFMKFCRHHDLDRIIDESKRYAKMLNTNSFRFEDLTEVG
jgi:5'-3' exonuclease